MAGRVYTAEEIAGWEKIPPPATAAPKRYTAAEIENWTKENADAAMVERLKMAGMDALRGAGYSATKPIANAADLVTDTAETLGSPLDEDNPISRIRDWAVNTGKELKDAPRSGLGMFSLGSGAGTVGQFAAMPAKGALSATSFLGNALLGYLNTDPEATQLQKAGAGAVEGVVGKAATVVPPVVRGGWAKLNKEAQETARLIKQWTGKSSYVPGVEALDPSSTVGKSVLNVLQGHPATTRQIRENSGRALNGLRESLIKAGGGRGADLRKAVDLLEAKRREIFAPVDKLNYRVPSSTMDKLIDLRVLPKQTKGERISLTPGEDMMDIRNGLSKLMNAEDPGTQRLARATRNELDAVYEKTIKQAYPEDPNILAGVRYWLKPEGGAAKAAVLGEASSQSLKGAANPIAVAAQLNQRKALRGEGKTAAGKLTPLAKMREIGEAAVNAQGRSEFLKPDITENLFKQLAGLGSAGYLGNMAIPGGAGAALGAAGYLASPMILKSPGAMKWMTQGSKGAGYAADLAEALRRASVGNTADDLSNRMPGGQ